MWLGIDFGNCYSKAAFFWDQKLELVGDPLRPNPNDSSGCYRYDSFLPSSVFITEHGEILVGHAAENTRVMNPLRYRAEFKRDLGSPVPYTLGNVSMLPEELVTEVLKKLKGEAEKVAERRGEKSLTDVVITVPATWGDYKRNLMQEAAEKAGFSQIQLLEEPVAVAIYYSRHAQANNGDVILVYDLGRETFDATLMQKQASGYQLLGIHKGLSLLGGTDFDHQIYQQFKSQCSSELRQQLESKEAWLARAIVANLCRDLKHQLSEKKEATIYIPIGLGEMEAFELTREAFNEMISPLIDETLDCCNYLLKSEGIYSNQVNQVLLSGGSCRIPYIQERIKQQFNCSVIKVDEPELAICSGAAIYGNIIIEENKNLIGVKTMKLGIDFGTCYSSAALLIDGVLRPAKEPLRPLESCFPSSVCVTKKGEVVISQAAENQRRLNPQGYKSHFKRDLETDIPYFLGEQQLRFMPEELVTIMLAGLKKEAEKIINTSLDSAVITVPATYLINKKRLMEQAAKKAGFSEVTMLEEPVAAAIYYSQKGTRGHQVNEGDILLVYDLGGGTFDAALIQKKGSSYELLCQPVGDKQCGGIYFDQLIGQDFIKQLQDDSILELLNSHRQDKEAIAAKLNLLDWCRNFKHQLSVLDEFEDLPPLGSDSYSLSREKFEEMIAPFIESSCSLCQQLVQKSGIKWEGIDRILLVGGSCRIPLVQKRLEQQFKRPVVAIDDPELAICFGAAIFGNMQVETQVKQAEARAKAEDDRKRREEEEERNRTETPALKSARGVDYTKLRDLLAAGKWKEADHETVKVMCQAAGRISEGWLDTLSIDDEFPCEDLRTINQLWLHYSKGKFGFSVQREIYESIGGTNSYSEEVWEKFGDRIGWRKGGKWLNYSDLTFNFELAFPAHLPVPFRKNVVKPWWLGGGKELVDWWLFAGGSVIYLSLFRKLVTCSATR